MWVVATVGKYHRPNKIYSKHRKRIRARESAKKISKELGYNAVIGIFELTPDKYYGLFETYINGKKR